MSVVNGLTLLQALPGRETLRSPPDLSTADLEAARRHDRECRGVEKEHAVRGIPRYVVNMDCDYRSR